MKKMFLVLLTLIIVGIYIPVVTAETVIINESLSALSYTGFSGLTYGNDYSATPGDHTNALSIASIENYQDLSYIAIDLSKDWVILEPGENELSYTLDGETNSARVYYTRYTNALGAFQKSRLMMFFDNWDVTGKSGTKSITFSEPLIFSAWITGGSPSTQSPIYFTPPYGRLACLQTVSVASSISWHNHLLVTNPEDYGYLVKLTRTIDGIPYASNIDITKNGEIIVRDDNFGFDYDGYFNVNEIDYIIVTTSMGDEFPFPLDASESGASDNTTVTVYVRNSQTNALLANAKIDISASVNGSLHEIVNETVPSGIYSIELQPTGGGMPNPDFYRLIVTAEGYNSIMPYIDFEVDGATTIYAYLDPIGGAPEDENNTFIDFFVRDMSANPISGATVNFGGYTLITNSAGYAIFEVDKNNTYTWIVSKSGYGSLTGNVVIGDDPRHTINTVLAPAVTPTTPTPIPTSTSISPTPTMTAPTGEPVSNWLEWFAAHFGMILGGGVEIGKIFMWLCFSVPVGVYVGKESKAGAAGFMAGAGIVTLFFVLIGWVPIWLLVLLALIIGLLYAKVFNNSDTGGGR